MAFRNALEDFERFGLSRTIFWPLDLIFVSLSPNGLGVSTSKKPLTDSWTALLASEGMASSLMGDSVSLTSLTPGNDMSGGRGQTESIEGDFVMNSLSLFPSAATDHSILGLDPTVICLEPTSTTGTEGDALLQESWLYTLADDIAVDNTAEMAVKTALTI